MRVATSPAELDAAQALRYRVFYEEMGAHADDATASSQRDRDMFDSVADHLLVIDHDIGSGAEGVVGTYRLIRRHAAQQAGRFYSSDEYDISPLLALDGDIMELGRSCVDIAHRTRAVMQLMWQGIAAYVHHYDVKLMFGCASLPGTNPQDLAAELTYLYDNHLAPPQLRARALDSRYVNMKLQTHTPEESRRVLVQLPPLVKGYLRLGGFVGDGAVIDEQFNTIDICIIVKTDLITQKYARHYERKREENAG